MINNVLNCKNNLKNKRKLQVFFNKKELIISKEFSSIQLNNSINPILSNSGQ